MKKKFSKILGIGLTLALLTSLLLTAAPVSALSQPSVTFDTTADAVISKVDAEYIISFRLDEELIPTDEIVVTFPEGTVVAAVPTVTIEAWILDGGTTLTEAFVDSPVAAGDVDTLEVVLTWSADTITTLGTAVVTFTAGITNPDTAADDYNLTVATQTGAATPVVIEAAVTSADYEITVPIIDVLPGIVQQFNAVNILMAQGTGSTAINTMLSTAQDNYTIVVGPGEYAITGTITITQEGLTLISSAGAEDTTIDAEIPTHAIEIATIAAEVTVDGFTITDDGSGTGIWCRGDDAIIQNNVVTFDSFGTGIDVSSEATGVTVSGNELNEDAAIILHGSDCTVSGNTFGHIMNFWALGTLEGVTITDNNFVANEDANFGILLRGDSAAGTIDDTLIEGNTIDGRANGGILIGADSDNLIVTDLTITGNDITNHGDGTGTLDSGIRVYATTVWVNSNAIKFNTITGNEDYGIYNEMAATIIDATFNWWGTDVAADIADMVSGTSAVTTDPFLADTAEAVFSATATTLDAKDTVGVRVSLVNVANYTIAVGKYIANPQAAKADAIAFFDVYVAGTLTDPATATIKFYAGDENSTLEVWSADTEAWADLSEDDSFGFSVYGGYMYIDYAADLLDGTPFVVVAGEAEADVIDPPTIATPVSGDDTVSLTPLFAWSAVTGAVGYDFQFADNANFVAPLVHLVGDNRLIVTAYAYVHELPYSTAYYWRVKAVSATAESAWVSGVFITKDEPVEPTPPVVIEETEPPVIIIEQPDIIVPLPAETPITPSWIYVIIGVGAVLVIALLVLIVRTRRVA